LIAASVAFLAGFMLVDRAESFPDPPDFSNMPIDEKKRAFFAFLSPMITAVNFELAADRDRVRRLRDELAEGTSIGGFDRRWIGRLAQRLEVPIDELELDEALAILERRAGIVPESLVLVQAAVESGWGTSRFALEGNNYFGQRCYRPDCGIEPNSRPDARFGLARFESAADSVESYILNLNTHPEYRGFRELRQQRRDAGEPITGLALVEGLSAYSERGEDYISDIESMILANNLE
jgi:Bax protein